MTYETWLSEIKNTPLPRYDQLPDISLYLDQVLEYINTKLMPFLGAKKYEITGSMINNYVKFKMMPAPIKKRYTKQHLAYIITISILKQVISIQTISQGIYEVKQEFGPESAFDTFVGFVEEGIKQILAQTYDGVLSFEVESIDTTLIPMKAACIAFAAKLVAERSFESLLEDKNG